MGDKVQNKKRQEIKKKQVVKPIEVAVIPAAATKKPKKK